MEPVGKIVGQGDGITRDFGVAPQAAGDEAPVKIGAKCQTGSDPDRLQSLEVGIAGKAEQQPSTHVGSLRAQGGNPLVKLPVADQVVGK